MIADVEAPTRSKARYIAFKILKEYWGLRNLLEIKVRRSTGNYPLTSAD
jgi:RNase P/RNase MRP subunit POP5